MSHRPVFPRRLAANRANAARSTVQNRNYRWDKPTGLSSGRYRAQADRHYRRAIEELARLKSPPGKNAKRTHYRPPSHTNGNHLPRFPNKPKRPPVGRLNRRSDGRMSGPEPPGTTPFRSERE
jgi:hypothetical protein